MKKKQHHWLDIAEYATLLGLGLGSVVSFASSQFFYSSAPLSLLILLNLANRNRMEQVAEQNTNKSLEDIDQRVSRNLELLQQQIQTLPTPEAIGSLRKSMLVKNRELAERLAGEIRTLQEGVQSVLQVIEQLNLGTVREDLDGLRDQYSNLNDGVANLTAQFQQLSAAGKFKDLERAIAQLQSDSQRLQGNLQSLADQTKPTLTSLQDQINHLNRQFQKLPPPFDSTALKQEVTELVRVVADLVPKRDWSTLVTELQSLQKQQESQSEAEEGLRRKLQEISQQLQTRPTKSSLTSLQNQINHLNRQFQKLPPPFDPTSLKREVAKLLKVVSDMVPKRDFGGLVAQVKALQQQQEFQTRVEQTLRAELQALNDQLQNLMVDGDAGSRSTGPATPPAQQEFQSRLEAMLHQEMAQISQQLSSLPTDGSEFQAQVEAVLRQELLEVNRQLQSYPEGPQYEFILDLKALAGAEGSSGSPGQDELHNSRSVLEQALERSQERLIVILPWSSQVSLDDDLMGRMEAFLQKNRRLDIGWCHQADRTQERLLKPIHQRWQLHSDIQDDLQTTLQKLLHLKRTYPQVLQFKILGTRENFLVSDREYAVLGLEEAMVGATNLPEVELKLRTTDDEAIQQFIQRFDNPVLRLNDAAAHWNRAYTRFDLGDRQGALEDCDQILAVTPDDIFALNFRGIIRYDMGDRQNAIADFNQSLQVNPQQTAAYCNRGYIRSELGDQLGAIADYSAALRIDEQSAVTYFLRGMACQKFGELEGAIADYTEALRLTPDSAILYYYRGLARPKKGDYDGAIADLNKALELFTKRGNEINARKVFNYLQQLEQSMPTPVEPPTTQEPLVNDPKPSGASAHPGAEPAPSENLVAEPPQASLPQVTPVEEAIAPDAPPADEAAPQPEVAADPDDSTSFAFASMQTLASLFDDEESEEDELPELVQEPTPSKEAIKEEPRAIASVGPNGSLGENLPLILNGSPSLHIQGAPDPSTLTLSNFLEDLNDAEELNPFQWESPEPATLVAASEEMVPNLEMAENGSSNGHRAVEEAHSEEGELGTLSDFCSQF
ncbi:MULTISPECIES: tetratricopeptide repeat protein [unclassified Leptolyngbya]|uniref:tetratricopeptide repeat protein n=1 Tax=unclassified Leptolyngbya TaxID=2650499 RepID=UPI0016854B85|nr:MULTISPECIES: tetratricopeptide repeat protein [unclassified Leptolyngbya]MBD1913592.1 tetratricopeptide repeat protein [Leptolyngbya sp. FACHB-8]MBD2155763.1 tetratricopeptide repeat protein [Leptolyngbya sp. FACHB-16]